MDGCVTTRVRAGAIQKEVGTLVGFIRMLLVISSIFSNEFILGISLILKLAHKYIETLIPFVLEMSYY